MPGAFDASPAFDDDPVATAEEIQRRGEDVLRYLADLASSEASPDVDLYLVREIHLRWFESTFPADAGVERSESVLNRKRTAVAVEAILPAVDSACGNWSFRRGDLAPNKDAEKIEFAVSEANRLAVEVYDAHPFIDGNTRATWHLWNYVLMLDGLRPLVDLIDQPAYEDAWWSASPTDHVALDEAVLTELAAQERS